MPSRIQTLGESGRCTTTDQPATSMETKTFSTRNWTTSSRQPPSRGEYNLRGVVQSVLGCIAIRHLYVPT